MNRKIFFDQVRGTVFVGFLSDDQVSGMDAVLNEWDRRKLSDIRWLAYMLATDYHETAHTMQAIAEYGKGGGRSYGAIKAETGKAYYGRGLVQLTWDYNYKKMGELLGVDLYRKPELALQLPIAVQIMFEGMIRGTFTGNKLSDYFTASKADWYNARRIINGTDRADLIAGYAKKFHAALEAATVRGSVIEPMPIPPDVPVSAPKPKPRPIPPEVPIAAGGAGAAAAAWWEGVPLEWIALAAVAVVIAVIIIRKWRD